VAVFRRARDRQQAARQRTSGSLGWNFHRLLGATAVSGLGDGMRLGALPLLAATLTRNPTAVAGMAVAQGVPWLLFSLPAGALTDRWNRQRVLVHVNVARALLVGMLAATVAAGQSSLPILYLLGFGLATVEAFADSASQAILPALVPTADLQRANGRLLAAQTTAAQFVGPPLGSAIFALRQALPFALDAVTFGVAAVVLARIRHIPQWSNRPAHAPMPLRTEIASALRWLLGHRLLRALAMVIVVDNLLVEGFFGVLVLFALQVLHLTQAHYGLLIATYAAGALVGSLLAVRARRLLGDAAAITGSIVLFGSPLLVIGIVPRALVTAVMIGVVGVGEGIWGVLTVSLRQAVIPQQMLGKVFGAFRLLVWASRSVGALLGGALATSFTLRAPAILSGIVIPLTALVIWPVLITRHAPRSSELLGGDEHMRDN
jgi:MFS family permease